MSGKIEMVNGSKTSFADYILSVTENRGNITVFTFGVGINQIQKLLYNFDTVEIIIDKSHATLNKQLYDRVVLLNDSVDSLKIKVASTHMKFAIIDDLLILTSANLSKNRKIEIYFTDKIKNIEGFSGIENFIKTLPDESIGYNDQHHENMMNSVEDNEILDGVDWL